jgi:hypothetical protein
MRRRIRATALLSFLLACSLQGCLITRIFETRTQLCDEKPPRVTVNRPADGGLRVMFAKPTLTDRDVVSIVGYEPTQVRDHDAVRDFSYEALPLDRPLDRTAGFVVRLSFIRLEGEFKLSQVEVPEKFNAILPPRLLDAAVSIVCKTQIGIVPPSTTFDLAPLDKSSLPTRLALTKLLGMPTTATARSEELLYEYCLAPCDLNFSRVAKLKFAFGSNGELNRADATYFRYAAVVDLISSRATATVKLQ